ncbi:MAG TPA: NADP-dependent oxidoreductase [Cytophagaceae bacterium]|jgi:NADPH:quinone reductase-like Zn-dependent oxidoreductase|nr:NADP-dependent oxidoreductase [Cytophagaceae bacterium]
MKVSVLPEEKIKSTAIMKAVRMHGYGSADVLIYEDAPIPEILPDEILIKVHAAGVNPIDWKIRQGYFKDRMILPLPLILGWDVSGTVEQTGILVTRFKKGDKVFAKPDGMRNGAYAQYIAVRSHETALAPESISLEHAAGIPVTAQTAWEALFEKGGLKQGQTVLIHGASGGVGSFAVQLARIAGAYVIATTSKDNIEMVRSLGAEEIIDYTSEDFSKKVQNIDLVFDTIGGETQAKSLTVLKKGGILVSTLGAPDPKETAKHQVRGVGFSLSANGARLAEIGGLVDSGMLKVVVDKEFSLKDVKEAHKLSESHHAKGKIILRVN